MTAGLLITLADPSGLVGMTKEAMAVGKAITESMFRDAPEIVKALGESVKNGGGRAELPDIPKSDPAQAKRALLGAIRTAVGTVETKSPGEVEADKEPCAACRDAEIVFLLGA